MKCIECGKDLACELNDTDDYGVFDLFHCYECDVLYQVRPGISISYIHNATHTLTQVADDIELTKKFWE